MRKPGQRQTELELGRKHPANQGHGIGPQHQQGHGERQRQHARQHQPLAIRNAHHLHGIELLRHAHDPDLRRDGRAGAACHQDSRQHGAKLTYNRHAKQLDDELACAKHVELLSRQIGQHNPDQKPHQRSNAQRLGTGAKHLGRNLAPWPP